MSENDETTNAAQFGSLGGKKRAEILSPEERKEIATRAAVTRWSRMPEAETEGILQIGEVGVEVYVLEDRRRLIHKRGIARALGLKSEGGNAFMKTVSRPGLGSAISEKLWDKIRNPIVFKPLNGDPAHGYDATTFVEVCDAIIQAGHDGKLKPSQQFLAIQAEIIIRSAAKLGIIALIDEATGYVDKQKEEYRKLFREFILDEFKQWEQEFPGKFFDMIYRLYGLKRKNINSFKHPQFFGWFIRKYIYFPLANSNGAILQELDKKNPVVYANGGRRYKFTQFLTDKVGVPAFRSHLWQVIGIGNSVTDKQQFDRSFFRAFPEALPRGRGDQKEFDF
jgi:P63C domain